MSSRYMTTQTSSMLAKMVLTNHWNAAGALVRYQPFIRPIAGAESCFPLVSGHNPDKMIRVPEIYLGVDFGLAGGVQKVRDQQEWVVILFGNFIEASKVNAELKGTILLFMKRTRAA